MCQVQLIVLQRVCGVLRVLSVAGAPVKLSCPVHKLLPGAQVPTCLPDVICVHLFWMWPVLPIQTQLSRDTALAS
jgi:hypothetical protein